MTHKFYKQNWSWSGMKAELKSALEVKLKVEQIENEVKTRLAQQVENEVQNRLAQQMQRMTITNGEPAASIAPVFNAINVPVPEDNDVEL